MNKEIEESGGSEEIQANLFRLKEIGGDDVNYWATESILSKLQSQIEPINSRISATSCAIAPSAPGLGLPQRAPELTSTVPMIDAFQSCQTLCDVEL
ncbi:MAG: hypothetical protein EZS28_031538, partial [Streblomastix strix]